MIAMAEHRIKAQFKGKVIELLPDTCLAEARGKRDPYKEEKQVKAGDVEKLRAFFEQTLDGMLGGTPVDTGAAWDARFKRGEGT